VAKLTPAQHFVLWFVAAAAGLLLATIFNASTVGTILLVAAVGIALGIGVGAWQARNKTTP
jgi:hypothetical protein